MAKRKRGHYGKQAFTWFILFNSLDETLKRILGFYNDFV